MKLINRLFLVLFLFGYALGDSQAGFWDDLTNIRSSTFQKVLQAPEFEMVPTQESPVTQTGRILKLETSYPNSYYSGGNVECRATILNIQDNRQFVASFTAYPVYRGEPWLAANLLRQMGVCQSAQRAFHRQQKVTITGMRQASAENNGMSVFSVQRFYSAPEGEGVNIVSGLPPAANVCTQIGCQATGLVTSFSYDLGDYLLCTAKMAIPSQNNATVDARIDLINKEVCRDTTCSPESLKMMQGRYLVCQMLENAFENNEPVTVLGYGQANGNQVQVINVTGQTSAPSQAGEEAATN